ncbi:transposase, MuDR, MULE transposase domain protein [Tanacetum coccineum]
MDTNSYNLDGLYDDVKKNYASTSDLVLSIHFVDKYATKKSFIELDSNETFMAMLNIVQDEAIGEPHVQDEAIGKPHDQDEAPRDPHNPTIQVNSKFPNVTELRKALNHHALINEFEYFIEKSEPTRFTARCAKLECEWKLHACVTQDKVAFKVKNLVETYSCIRSNKGGNKSTTQGCIANVVSDKRVYRGKEQAFIEVYGKWEDSFIYIDVYKEELQSCRPYISLDACHLKESWTWFLENLRKAKGTPDGLVISSDMQKGLAIAIMQIYPNSEHKECIRHLYSNFKKKFMATSLPSSCGVWSRSKFGTIANCDYITNNISEAFNSLISKVRFQPVLDLLDVIREKIMVHHDERRRLVGKWKAAFIRDANWEKYVDPYYTIKKFKEAYALEITPLPDKDEWMDIQPGEKKYPPIFFNGEKTPTERLEPETSGRPPIIKHPAGRPRKNRIIAADEHTKRRHKCLKCGGLGHRPKTCKNAQSEGDVLNYAFLASRLQSASLQTKLLRYFDIVSFGLDFDNALNAFNLKMKIDLLSNPSEIAAPKFMKKTGKDHVVSCAGIVGIKHRHNVVRDILVDICFQSRISAGKEVDIGLGSSPLMQTGMVDFVHGHAVIEAAQRKRVKYEANGSESSLWLKILGHVLLFKFLVGSALLLLEEWGPR